MAIFQNDPFPGTDYTQFLNWKKVTTPAGQTFYEVPGQPAYVYDPVASNASGRKVFRANPSLAISKQQEEEQRLKDAQEQESFNRSPLGQVLPVAASTGGLIAASQLGAFGGNSSVPAVAALGQGTTSLGSAAAQGATGGLSAPNVLSASRVPLEGGAVAPVEGLGVTPYLGLAGAGLGAYGLYNAINSNDTKSGALSGAGLGLGLGAAAPLVGLGPVGWGGLAGMAALGALGGGGLTSILGHKTTRERQQDTTERLLEQAGNDPVAQSYVQGMREQFKSAPPDPSKPFAGGKYGSWDEYKKAGLEASDLTGVEGNIDTYTPQEWARLNFEQQKAITQANIDSGLYYSEDGGVKISDKKKAQENKDAVLKGFNAGVQTVAQTPAQAAAQGAIQTKKPYVTPLPAGQVVPTTTIVRR